MTTKADILHTIRQKCIDCCCHQLAEIRRCSLTSCALWSYRMGIDPNPSEGRGFAGQPRSGHEEEYSAPASREA
jgi:hypothetical protein